MSQDPSQQPSRPERGTAPDVPVSGSRRVDEDLETTGREREGEYVDKDVPVGDDHAPEHSYVDKDVEADTSRIEREGEYVDKDVSPGDTHSPQHSYVDKDVPD